MKTSPPGQDLPQSDEALEAQALRWLRLLHSGDAREIDAARFKRWLEADPAHRTAYVAMKRRWDSLEAPARALLRRRPDVVPAARASRRLHHGRRALLGGIAGIATVAGVAAVKPPMGMWPGVDEWGADARTRAGQQRTLSLGDGVDITLNTRTSIRHHRQAGTGAALELINGEASVVTGAGQEVSLIAGAGHSRTVAGRFDVRNLGGRVCVTCVSEAVTVVHPQGTCGLMAGQQVCYDQIGVGDVGRVDLTAVTAWREGTLVFDRVPFSGVIDELNRYRPGRVVLMNDAVSERPVSGRFRIEALDLALLQLQESFGLKARSLPAGVLILS